MSFGRRGWIWGEKYCEYLSGVYDACKSCGGKPMKQKVDGGGFLVECQTCFQCVGYEDTLGEIMVAWNKEQRK